MDGLTGLLLSPWTLLAIMTVVCVLGLPTLAVVLIVTGKLPGFRAFWSRDRRAARAEADARRAAGPLRDDF